MKVNDYYVLFPNVNEGLMLEKKLKENSIKYTIVPTPRELSKCCGISIKYFFEDEEGIKRIVEENKIKVVGFHCLERRNSPVKFV